MKVPGVPVAAAGFETYESIYWVFTHRCNDNCAHCYNDSSPRGEVMPLEDGLAVVDNLPARLGRLILSGGEPLTEEKKLHAILEAVQARYGTATQVMLQTNGDLLDGRRLDALLARGVTRIDVASIDRFHKHRGEHKQRLVELFESRGLSGDDPDPLIEKDTYLKREAASYGFWGATEDMWLGGNWARGEALRKDVWLRDGDHNFCAILSGARGFHKHLGEHKQRLVELFESRGLSGDDPDPLIEKDTYLKKEAASYGFWGATEDMWLGGNWARGEALRKDVWLRDGDHNFCAILSGARGFLGGTDLPQELCIQLWKISPCCPGTFYPLGDARREKVSAVLDRIARSPVFQKLNEGDAYGMGEQLGVGAEEGHERARALGNVCLWCDEFMQRWLEADTLAPRPAPGPEPRRVVRLPVRAAGPDAPA